MRTLDTSLLPDHAPVPRSALNEQGYYVNGGLDEMAHTAATPVIEKYTGILAVADVFTESTPFHVRQSLRLDLGCGWPVQP
jgi:hypothetical protein